MKKKIISRVTTLCVCASMLVGCGGGSESKSESESGTPSDSGARIKESEIVEDGITVSSEYNIVAGYYFGDIHDELSYFMIKDDSNLYGLMDSSGKVLIEPKYDDLNWRSQGDTVYLEANYEDSISIIDENDNTIVKPDKYVRITTAGEDVGWLAQKSDGTEELLDMKGKLKRKLSRRYKYVVDGKYLFFNTYQEDTAEIENNTNSTMLFSPIEEATFEFYDLEENLIENKIGVTSYNGWYINGYQLVVPEDDNRKMIVYKDFSDEVVTLSDTSIGRLDTASIHDDVLKYYNSTLYLDDQKVYYVDLKEKKFLDEYKDPNFEITLEKSSNRNFITLLDQNGEKVIDRRLTSDYQKLEFGYVVTDTDGQTALISLRGKVLIPFGEHILIDDSDEFLYDDYEILTDGIFGDYGYFKYQDEDGIYHRESFEL